MFKNLNQRLISSYPLLWNTRLHLVLPAAIIIHILFYLAGLMVPIGLDELSEYHVFNMEDETTFSLLVSAIIIIIWLAYYLRNNPFKSFYPLSRNYMFGEFLLIFLVFFSTSTFFLTYKQGLYDNVRMKTNDIDLVAEGNIFNLAQHFISYNENEFDIWDCCDSIDARRERDSVEAVSRMHHSYRESGTSEPDIVANRSYDQVTTYEDTIPPSYLYYCVQNLHLSETAGKLLNGRELNDIAVRWLKGQKRDSVLHLLNNHVALCQKYGVKHRFDPRMQVQECFNDSHFTVRHTIATSFDANRDRHFDFYFIETYTLNASLSKIDDVRGGFWSTLTLLMWVYFALGGAIVLYSFRLTRLKHWFMAIIGIGLWCILVGLIAVTSRLEEGIAILLIILWVVFLVLSVSWIQNRVGKLFSGISLNWTYWFAPFIIPLIFVVIYEATRVHCYDYPPVECPPPPAINVWINHNWDIINSINISFLILATYFVFIPLARKWQANPEE